MDVQLIGDIPDGLQLQSLSIFGIQWMLSEFVECCLNATHPCDSANVVPEVLHETVECVCKMSDVELAKQRLLFLKPADSCRG